MNKLLSALLAGLACASLLTGCGGKTLDEGLRDRGVLSEEDERRREETAPGSPADDMDRRGGGYSNGAAPDAPDVQDDLMGDMSRGVGLDSDGDGIADDNVLPGDRDFR